MKLSEFWPHYGFGQFLDQFFHFWTVVFLEILMHLSCIRITTSFNDYEKFFSMIKFGESLGLRNDIAPERVEDCTRLSR